MRNLNAAAAVSLLFASMPAADMKIELTDEMPKPSHLPDPDEVSGDLYTRHFSKRASRLADARGRLIEEATRMRTAADHDRLAAARAKRDRKAAKRLQKGHL